ncbi:hypothetical protein, partial [Streptomyces sp. NPDC059515]|uniref:hypothetical protein n=1 Tax=Streptomyces sp. NPDC059515 TaxID=3346854 RepID=UPI0036860A72
MTAQDEQAPAERTRPQPAEEGAGGPDGTAPDGAGPAAGAWGVVPATRPAPPLPPRRRAAPPRAP